VFISLIPFPFTVKSSHHQFAQYKQRNGNTSLAVMGYYIVYKYMYVVHMIRTKYKLTIKIRLKNLMINFAFFAAKLGAKVEGRFA
jgi:hypothetical protein